MLAIERKKKAIQKGLGSERTPSITEISNLDWFKIGCAFERKRSLDQVKRLKDASCDTILSGLKGRTPKPAVMGIFRKG